MRKYIAFYPTDHLRKTQHLDTLQHGALFLLLQHCWSYGSIPLEPAARAAIARMTLSAWRKVAPVVDAFFDSEGRNKRASEEIAKANDISLKRALAGRRGGLKSGLSKSIAIAMQMPLQLLSKSQSNCVAIKKDIYKTTTGYVERGPGNEETPTSDLSRLTSVMDARRLGRAGQ